MDLRRLACVVLQQTHPLPPHLVPGTEMIRQELPDGRVRQPLLLPIIDDVERRSNKRHSPNDPRFLPEPNTIGRYHQRARGLKRTQKINVSP